MKLRLIALGFALAAPSLAWGEALDAPERLARLAYVEGEVTFQAANGRATDTLPDRPLHPGDRITTDSKARAELALGTATIRLDERTEFTLRELDATTLRVELASGTASVYLDELLEGETFKVQTPNAAITLEQRGEYRVDVHSDEVSVLTARGGTASIATAGGPVRVAAGQRVRIEGRDAIARLETPRPADAFDDWVLERELRLADTEAPRYTPNEGGAYEELDRYGEWYDEPHYGRVWMPGYSYAGWSPYGSGYWQHVGAGRSWYDPAPWGFSTYYGGRWTYLRDRNRWCWVPTRHLPRHYTHDDDRPYGYPRYRDVPESAPRTLDARSDDVNVAGPVMLPREGPRGRSTGRDSNREPRPAAPAAEPPQSGGATIRPSSNAPPRTRPSPDSSPRISKGTATPQEP
jgi:hypothetical protein